MPIDPKIEQPTRTMLGYAIRHELEDLASLVRATGNDALLESIRLCLVASAYIAIDVCERWPTDVDLHEIAKNSAESVTGLDITKQEIFQYLSRNALGSERLDEVFSEEGMATVPLFATANLLLTFCPHEKHWGEYLDQIWDAVETAERTRLSILPALMLRAHNERKITT
jgi:hypothetical protein